MNKKPQKLVLGAVAALAMFAANAADKPGYYAGGHLGVNDVTSWDADVNFGGPSTAGSLKLDRGLQFGVFAGRRTEHARFEVEYQRGQAKITGVTLGPVSQSASGHATYQALTLNAYRTFEINDRTTAYGGVGVGWGKASLPRLAPVGACNCFQGASDSGFTWLARLGAEYQLAERHYVFAQYTLLHVPGPSSNATPSVSYDSKNVNSLAIGYRAGF